ncbi:hypothetical protein M721_10450 [Neisseria gonorrhoeae ALB_2011_03_03]|nr:hypothetical protein M721_10450 [Neisseria gonorrhoeae ALB_2011_03_03]
MQTDRIGRVFKRIRTKKADIPARPYRYGNHASDSDGGILPVVLR